MEIMVIRNNISKHSNGDKLAIEKPKFKKTNVKI